jgi:hypothetical protein
MSRRRYRNITGHAAQRAILEGLDDLLTERALLRMRLMFPPPLDSLQLLQVLYSRDEIAAMSLLTRRGLRNLIGTERDVTVALASPPDDIMYVRIPHGVELPVAYTRLPDGRSEWGIRLHHMELTYPVQLLTEWMGKLRAERQIVRTLRSKLLEIAGGCSTVGQALRVWPDIQYLLLLSDKYSEFRAAGGEGKVRSPIPSAFYTDKAVRGGDGEVRFELKESWRPEALAEYSPYLASLHMLPDKSNVKVAFTTHL